MTRPEDRGGRGKGAAPVWEGLPLGRCGLLSQVISSKLKYQCDMFIF
uniref:Uncharacterized protein n=1 Tax=Anguilla anguilla TaxID=7936 RepID=A0A0E9XC52_ANGAN